MSKRKKWMILLGVFIAVLLAALALLLWLFQGQDSPNQADENDTFLILRDQNTNEVVACQLKVGLGLEDELELPLDYYELNHPQNWIHELPAAETADEQTGCYEDGYLIQDLKGTEWVAYQQIPAQQQYYLFTTDTLELQVVEHEGRDMLYATTKGVLEDTVRTYIFWVQGNSLLSLSYESPSPGSVEQMVELTDLVEQTPTDLLSPKT